MQFISGSKQDPMLRMYFESIAENGDKIPFLPSKLLLEMCSQKNGMRPHIVIYAMAFENSMSNMQDFLQIILEQNGNIMLRGSLETPMEYTDFNNWLQGICNNVFTDINDYLMQSGYQVRGFTSLKDPYLRVSNISCSMTLELTRKLNLEDHLKCLSAILANEPNVKIRKDGESYRYIE